MNRSNMNELDVIAYGKLHVYRLQRTTLRTCRVAHENASLNFFCLYNVNNTMYKYMRKH